MTKNDLKIETTKKLKLRGLTLTDSDVDRLTEVFDNVYTKDGSDGARPNFNINYLGDESYGGDSNLLKKALSENIKEDIQELDIKYYGKGVTLSLSYTLLFSSGITIKSSGNNKILVLEFFDTLQKITSKKDNYNWFYRRISLYYLLPFYSIFIYSLLDKNFLKIQNKALTILYLLYILTVLIVFFSKIWVTERRYPNLVIDFVGNEKRSIKVDLPKSIFPIVGILIAIIFGLIPYLK